MIIEHDFIINEIGWKNFHLSFFFNDTNADFASYFFQPKILSQPSATVKPSKVERVQWLTHPCQS